MEQSNKHILISDLSEEYADRMCEGDNDRRFCRGSIAAAYVIGAKTTLRRVCGVIMESAVIGGVTAEQSQTLLRIIEHIESTPKSKRHGRLDNDEEARI